MNTYSFVLFVKLGLFIAIVAAATPRNINNTFLLFLEVEEPISLCLKVISLPIMGGKDNRKVINSFWPSYNRLGHSVVPMDGSVST
jgi:hypothetical protein